MTPMTPEQIRAVTDGLRKGDKVRFSIDFHGHLMEGAEGEVWEGSGYLWVGPLCVLYGRADPNVRITAIEVISRAPIPEPTTFGARVRARAIGDTERQWVFDGRWWRSANGYVVLWSAFDPESIEVIWDGDDQ